MDASITQPKKYEKVGMQTTHVLPAEKAGKESTYPFQWLVYKPQAHVIAPFETQQQSRLGNSERK